MAEIPFNVNDPRFSKELDTEGNIKRFVRKEFSKDLDSEFEKEVITFSGGVPTERVSFDVIQSGVSRFRRVPTETVTLQGEEIVTTRFDVVNRGGAQQVRQTSRTVSRPSGETFTEETLDVRGISDRADRRKQIRESIGSDRTAEGFNFRKEQALIDEVEAGNISLEGARDIIAREQAAAAEGQVQTREVRQPLTGGGPVAIQVAPPRPEAIATPIGSPLENVDTLDHGADVVADGFRSAPSFGFGAGTVVAAKIDDRLSNAKLPQAALASFAIGRASIGGEAFRLEEKSQRRRQERIIQEASLDTEGKRIQLSLERSANIARVSSQLTPIFQERVRQGESVEAATEEFNRILETRFGQETEKISRDFGKFQAKKLELVEKRLEFESFDPVLGRSPIDRAVSAAFGLKPIERVVSRGAKRVEEFSKREGGAFAAAAETNVAFTALSKAVDKASRAITLQPLSEQTIRRETGFFIREGVGGSFEQIKLRPLKTVAFAALAGPTGRVLGKIATTSAIASKTVKFTVPTVITLAEVGRLKLAELVGGPQLQKKVGLSILATELLPSAAGALTFESGAKFLAGFRTTKFTTKIIQSKLKRITIKEGLLEGEPFKLVVEQKLRGRPKDPIRGAAEIGGKQIKISKTRESPDIIGEVFTKKGLKLGKVTLDKSLTTVSPKILKSLSTRTKVIFEESGLERTRLAFKESTVSGVSIDDVVSKTAFETLTVKGKGTIQKLSKSDLLISSAKIEQISGNLDRLIVGTQVTDVPSRIRGKTIFEKPIVELGAARPGVSKDFREVFKDIGTDLTGTFLAVRGEAPRFLQRTKFTTLFDIEFTTVRQRDFLKKAAASVKNILTDTQGQFKFFRGKRAQSSLQGRVDQFLTGKRSRIGVEAARTRPRSVIETGLDLDFLKGIRNIGIPRTGARAGTALISIGRVGLPDLDKSRSKFRTFAGEDFGLGEIGIPRTGARFAPRLGTGIGLRSDLGRVTLPRFPPPTFPGFPGRGAPTSRFPPFDFTPPRFTAPVVFFPPTGGGIGVRRTRPRKKRLRLKFAPSVAAKILNITARAPPKILTGVGIRPIITRRKKKNGVRFGT